MDRAFLKIVFTLLLPVLTAGVLSTAFAGPGNFFKFDLLPEFLDPYDLYFSFWLHRFERPGGSFEIPRSQFLNLYAGKMKLYPKGVRRMEIVFGKTGVGGWETLFDLFYDKKRAVCEFDRSGNLVSAIMHSDDASREINMRSRYSYDAAGRLSAETAEVYPTRAFTSGYGAKFSGVPVEGREPDTNELDFRRIAVYKYSGDGLLKRVDISALRQAGHYEYEYDETGKLVKTTIFESTESGPYFTQKYSYDAGGRLSKSEWTSGYNNKVEMVYEYQYDSAENCVKIMTAVYPIMDMTRDRPYLDNTFAYDRAGRVVGARYFNHFKNSYNQPDSVSKCVYDARGLLKEVDIESKKFIDRDGGYSIKYSYEFYD